MLAKAFNRYIDNFRGFSREIWILTLSTFINRAGTMVLPFLSKYLREDLGFSLGKVGWIMVCFGLGSMTGSYIGGKLTDKIGFYRIMVFSMFTSGLLLFAIQRVTSFYGLCAAMFVLMAIADMFRPAVFVSIRTYARPENRTRAMTLLRVAINLGISAGPALGGLIIMGIGYKGLFWVDGATCIAAITLFFFLIKEKKNTATQHPEGTPKKSPLTDIPFAMFLYCSFIIALIFFQLFTTLPLYHHDGFGLSEVYTGLLISLNGVLIFIFEMPLVGFMERKNIPKMKVITVGSFFMALAFYILLFNFNASILVINILFITLAQMLCFPFANSFALGRAPRGQEGHYMALYTMTFSLAHIMSAKTGMEIIATIGYTYNWLIMGSLGLTATLVCYLVHKKLLHF
ncbi:MFS transporter [Flavobacterium rhizosphaerae]|uniref:MFS transporter n=1 Tax=Flavobacterium rhizosphaerae TaxID=3163298 RepID=A0ABW8YT88_9FLAO